MKRTRFWFVGAFVLISALLVGAVRNRNQNPRYQLSRYPQTREFRDYVSELWSEVENPYAGWNDTLLQFNDQVKGDWSEVSGVEVGGSGRFSLGSIYPPHFKVGKRFSDLQPQQIAEIKELMRQLPPSAPPEKREDLLIVLIYRPHPPQIRIYDQRKPPTQIQEIVEMTAKIITDEKRPSNSQNAID